MYYEDHSSEWIPFSRYKYRVTTENKAGEVRSTWKRITTAEGIPENMTRQIINVAEEKKVNIIGPATVGGVKPGCFKIGNTGGMMDNILHSKLYRHVGHEDMTFSHLHSNLYGALDL